MAGQTTSSKALIYLSERVEDATEAVKGLIGGAGSSKYLDTLDERTSVIRSQLESDRDDLRMEGLRTIVALLSKGRDASSHFPQVLKLTSNANLEIKKLVYIIVRRYAKKQPDVALLGINSFQRDLLDRSEVVRAMALRVLSGLRLPLVASVVEVAIAKCAKDPHFYVRKGAALAIVKCHQLAPHIRSALKGHLATLLNDRYPAVLSTALVAYSTISPLDFQALHAHYRKLCHALSDMDEWGQQNAIQVLGLYARHCLTKPSEEKAMDVDLQLLFAKVEDLLMSRNASVVTAAIRLLHTLAPASYHTAIARPLVRLTKSSPGISYFALINCYLLARSSPSLLSPHVEAFVLRSSLHETSYISSLKLTILVQLSDSSNWEMIMSELCEQSRYHSDDQVSQTAVEMIGTLARKDAKYTQDCTMELLKLVKDCHDRDLVVGAAVSVLRRLVQSQADREKAVIVNRLASLLFTPPSKKNSVKKVKLVGRGTVKSGLARSCIYWLLGQYCRLEVDVRRKKGDAMEQLAVGASRLTLAQVVGADVLRRAAINFTKEDSMSRLQIITLSSKLVVFLPTVSFEQLNTIKLIHGYIMQLARYDEDFDIRDRGRFCKTLIDRVESAVIGQGLDEGNDEEKERAQQLGGVVLRRDQVLHILFEGKRVSLNDTFSLDKGGEKEATSLDSLSFVLGGGKTLSQRSINFCSVPWADEKDLPPTSVRQPALFATSTKPGLLDHQQSFSSDSPNDERIDSTLPATSKGVETTHSRASSSAAKYKDLDAFLEEESEEEEEASEEEEAFQEDNDEEEEDEEEEQRGDISGTSEEETEDESDEGEDRQESDKAGLLPAALEEENEWAR